MTDQEPSILPSEAPWCETADFRVGLDSQEPGSPMKVLFIYTVSNSLPPPAKPIAEWIEVSFSVSYLVAALESAGHEVDLLVLRHGSFRREVKEALAHTQPEMVCYTAVATEHTFCAKVARSIRQWMPGIYQVIGGVHATLRPDDCIQGPFDAVCIGEGEDAIVELAGAVQSGERPTAIQSFWFQNPECPDNVEKNPTRPFNPDIDSIVHPNREIWRPWIEEIEKHAMLIARGCPFTCTYCSNHALRKTQDGKFVRFRSPEDCVDELRELVEQFPDTTYCYFEVETISAGRSWAYDFAKLLEEFNAEREVPLEFAINLMVHHETSFMDLFKALKKANFSYLRIGLESGSYRVRKAIMRRNHTNDDLINTFAEAHEAGLGTYAYNLVGLPGETPEDFQETIELNRRCNPTRSYISIFHPYPGTDLERTCVERGIKVPAFEDTAERYRARLSLPEFPNRLVEYYFRNFPALVKGKQEPFFNRVDAYVWQTVRGYPWLARRLERVRGTGILTRLRRIIRPSTGKQAPEVHV
jgi:anaerobic magnesium-protoporphyrin IX monomethyl ester cyclase